jgi:hypothetical protein
MQKKHHKLDWMIKLIINKTFTKKSGKKIINQKDKD